MSRHLHAHAVIAAALLAMPCRLGAQPTTSAQRALASWIAFDAPTGEESRTTPNLVKPLEAATGGRVTVDALGNVIIRKGSGMPKRVVACAIDRPGFAVTQITRDGMLRLHRVGGASHQLWDQAHEGQQLEILTERGAVPAVAAIRNGHFVQQHSRDTLVVTADDLWVDVGARTAAEVASLGVRLLDPVQRRLASWTYASHAAGANAGARTGCAAIMAASRGTVSRGETMFVLSVQGVFGFPGLGGVLARQVDFRADSITVVVGARASRLDRWTRAAGASPVNEAVLRAADVEGVHLLAPAVRAAGTLVESIEIGEADWLLTQVVRAAGASDLPADPWITIPVRERRVAPRLNDPHAPVMRLLQQLADLPGVPGQEWRVREAIEAQLPAWAKAIATVDDAGNLIVSTGPARDTVVFMAHMDEVSYDVQSIARDGTVTLRGRGGVANSAWEGQAALLHLPRPASGVPDTLPGIFVPRENGRVRTALTVTAFFGMDSAALVARGVRIGDGVTSPKTSVRLAGSRFTGRSMDDRAGSTALLLAVRGIDPKMLDHAVMFVWTTSEETGLAGAIALANRVGATVRRAYSIDTFVSSETPLESSHFAFVSLGGGPVLRAIETSSVSPRSIRRGVEAAARTSRIPLQTGLTQGGTDGTAFTFFGAPNTGLSWPGRYSHTPAEVLDLQDLQQLATLIRALAMQRP